MLMAGRLLSNKNPPVSALQIRLALTPASRPREGESSSVFRRIRHVLERKANCRRWRERRRNYQTNVQTLSPLLGEEAKGEGEPKNSILLFLFFCKRSPSPRPSPPRRGRIVVSLFCESDAFLNRYG